MNDNKKMQKVGVLYLFGNVFDKAMAFITVPIFTRMMSTADYGYTTTYLSWVSILTVLITLSLGNSIRSAVVDFPDNKDEYVSSIFGLGTICAFVMTLILSVVSILFREQLPLSLVLLCCANSYAVSIITAVKWQYMMELKYVKRTLLQSVPNILVVVLSVILILNMSKNKYFGRIYANTIVFFVIALIYVLIYFFKGRKIVNIKYWKYALAFSLPLIFHSLSTVVLSQADRSMLTTLKSASETGIYGIAYQFGMVPMVVITTLENMWIPWFTKRMEEKEKNEINAMAKNYVMVVSIICAGVIMVAPEILKFMTTSEYHSAIYLIAPIVLANFFMFLASISIDYEYYLKRTKVIAFNTLIAAAVNIVLNYIFIPRYGAVAAAYTTVTSYIVSFLMHYIYTKKQDNGLFTLFVYAIPVVLVVVMTVLSYILMPFVIARWSLGVVLGFAFLIYGKRMLTIKY